MRVLTVFLIIVSGCKSYQDVGKREQILKDATNVSCTHIDKVEDEKLRIENNRIFLNWTEPVYKGTCSISYALDILNDHNETVFSAKTTKTTHVIDFNFIGCAIYNLTIKPEAEGVQGSILKMTIAIPKEMKPPNCNIKEIRETSVLFECTFDEDEDNLCEITDFVISCMPDNAIKAIINQNITVRNKQVELKNLSKFTNYSCTVSREAPDKVIKFQTKQGIPGPPVLNTVSLVTNTSFEITWDPPIDVPGVLTTYNVTVIGKDPLYFVPEYCNVTAQKNYGGEVDGNQLQYTVTNLLPSYEYEVFVKAKTMDYGPSSETKLIQTYGGIPEEPRDVDFAIVNVEYPDNKIRLDVNWSFPCFANNIITSFKIEIVGFPLVDYHVGEKKETKIEYATNTTTYYKTLFESLEPAYNYTVSVKSLTINNLESNGVIFNFKTPGSSPQAPIVKNVVNVTSTSFTIEWLEPHRKNGKLDGYYIYLFTRRLNDYILEGCPVDLNLNVFESMSPNRTMFTFENALPGFNYTVTIHASTEGRNGSNVTFYVHTLDAEPEEIRSLNFAFINKHQEYYNGNVTINFKPPCNFNGNFQYISIVLNGSRTNKKPHFIAQNISLLMPEYNHRIEMWAQYEYELIVQVVTENYVKSTTRNFISPSGVPLLTNYHMKSPIAISSSQAEFNVSKYLFDDSYGDIIYYAIIIGQCSYEEKPMFGFWEGNEESWPAVNGDASKEGMEPHALTPKFWNPLKDHNVSEFTFIIQESILQPNIWYSVKVRGFTKNGYRDSSELIFKLPEDYDISALMFGVIFGILGTAILLGSVFILWRKRKRWATKKESIKSISLNPIPISVKLFPRYYNNLSNDADKLKQEYTLLISKSNELTLPCSQGLAPENKKKNRYTNVIAYDHSRVKLKDVEEDGSDYINASYIKGYSGTIEYIATQGALEHTVVDFWKMVIQENSTLIVMVAQFVEQNKDKCFKYFPDNHENLELENGIAIRCCTELDFNTYTVRTLLVQKDLEQWTVTHLQFTDWPDFGCPTGTQMMLEFCQLMRDYADKSDSPIILHCSAGIGRTGTIIALDILLQAISEDKNLDIFNTVLDLRKDRKNMVQTEKQYLYIHNCVSDAIQEPALINNCITEKEPIYENLEEIKKEHNGLSVNESQF